MDSDLVGGIVMLALGAYGIGNWISYIREEAARPKREHLREPMRKTGGDPYVEMDKNRSLWLGMISLFIGLAFVLDGCGIKI